MSGPAERSGECRNFVVLGQAVPLAGPAIVVSFVLAGITALFSALSYAELAGLIPALRAARLPVVQALRQVA